MIPTANQILWHCGTANQFCGQHLATARTTLWNFVSGPILARLRKGECIRTAESGPDLHQVKAEHLSARWTLHDMVGVRGLLRQDVSLLSKLSGLLIKTSISTSVKCMVVHLFQNYDTIYVRFFPTYTCNHSCYTIYVRFFATYTCVLSCFVGFLFPRKWLFSYKRAYICARKKPMYTAISRKVVGKNVHATIPQGNMGYDRYTVPDHCSCLTYFVPFR